MKRYEKILVVSALIMLFAGFGIAGALDTNIEVSIIPIITFIISSLVSALMIYFEYLDR